MMRTRMMTALIAGAALAFGAVGTAGAAQAAPVVEHPDVTVMASTPWICVLFPSFPWCPR